MRRFLTTVATIFSAICANPGFAEPMPQATLDEAVRSPNVVIASYQGHQPVTGQSNEDIYFSGVTANYKIESVLKPSSQSAKEATSDFAVGKNLNVQYLVHDLSPCLVDQSFRFSEQVMPAKGSRWILFLQTKANKDSWHTYRGNEGRLEANDSNIKLVKTLLTGKSSPTKSK